MSAEIVLDINPESADVGQASSIDRLIGVNVLFLVIGVNFGEPLVNIVGQQMNAPKPLQHLAGTELNRRHIDIDRPFDPTRTGLDHAAPVAERVLDQSVGRNGRDRPIEVLHLDGGQRNVNNRAVGIVFGHLNPITDAQHVIGGQLDAGDKSQDGVLKNQKNNSRHRTQSGQQKNRAFINDLSNDDDQSNDNDEDLDTLKIGLDRFFTGDLVAVVDVVNGF